MFVSYYFGNKHMILSCTFQINLTTMYFRQTLLRKEQKKNPIPSLKSRRKEKNKRPNIKLCVHGHIQLLTFTPLVTAVEQRGDSSGKREILLIFPSSRSLIMPFCKRWPCSSNHNSIASCCWSTLKSWTGLINA